jgi:hypothetical protein
LPVGAAHVLQERAALAFGRVLGKGLRPVRFVHRPSLRFPASQIFAQLGREPIFPRHILARVFIHAKRIGLTDAALQVRAHMAKRSRNKGVDFVPSRDNRARLFPALL